jgi:hypothetical protein
MTPHRSSTHHYRHTAAVVREMAQRITPPEIRAELLELAERCERLDARSDEHLVVHTEKRWAEWR